MSNTPHPIFVTQEEYHLRPAAQSDAPDIRALVRATGINPLGLDWRRFILAVDAQERVIGCGQVKTHRDGSRELASIAVHPNWRCKGIARAIITHLLSEHSGPLYLTCRERLKKFYERFGFQAVRPLGKMPPYFRRVAWLFDLLKRIGLLHEGLLVMIRPGQKKGSRIGENTLPVDTSP